MKGRGCRVIKSDDLQGVTPDARQKTHFVIVDAVGVCERDKTPPKVVDRKPSVPLDKVLNTVAAGAVSDEMCSTLAARLTRLDRQVEPDRSEQVAEQPAARRWPSSAASCSTPSIPMPMPDGPQRSSSCRRNRSRPKSKSTRSSAAMADALKPFHNPKLRKTILEVKAELEQVIDEVNKDVLLFAGQSQAAKEKAKTVLSNFRQFIEDNKDEIEALQILYSRPYRSGLRYRQVKELAEALKRPPLAAPLERLWRAYELVEPEKVKGAGGQAACRRRGPGAACPRPEFALGARGHDRGRTLPRMAWPPRSGRNGVHGGATEVAGRHQGPYCQQPADRTGRFR